MVKKRIFRQVAITATIDQYGVAFDRLPRDIFDAIAGKEVYIPESDGPTLGGFYMKRAAKCTFYCDEPHTFNNGHKTPL